MNILSNNPTEVLILLFLTVTFLQSGIDKIVDWNGNLSFIKDHFKNSPLINSVPLLLMIILILEVIAGLCMIFGVYQLYTSGAKEIALFGVELSAITLIFLLIGQHSVNMSTCPKIAWVCNLLDSAGCIPMQPV